jgi:hypothetical protein
MTKPLTSDEMLTLLLTRGRVVGQRSYARESKYYGRLGDPANHIKLQGKGSSMEGTKEIENILRHELDNWMRWARRRDYLPVSFRVPLGYLFKSTDVHDGEKPIRITVDEIGAAGFERIIVSLPQRHREAFIMYQLGRAAVAGKVRIIKGRDDCANLIGLRKSQYHEVVRQAHSMVLRKVKSVKESAE